MINWLDTPLLTLGAVSVPRSWLIVALLSIYLAWVATKKRHSAPLWFVIAVGGFRSREAMERALAQGIDLIALSRPLIREPNLPRRLFEGRTEAASCVSCNRCVIAIGFQEQPLRCYYEKR